MAIYVHVDLRICNLPFSKSRSLLRPGLFFPQVRWHVVQAQVSILGIFMASGRFCSPEYAAWMQPLSGEAAGQMNPEQFLLACPDSAFQDDLFAEMYIYWYVRGT